MKVTFKALDKPNDFKKWVIDAVEQDVEILVANLALMAEISIKTWIINSSKMPTGALANAFFKEQLSKYAWGIGDIEFLNKTVPYWRHINFGSLAIGANWQHILPKGHWDNGRWIIGDSDTDYFAMPNTPIQAHNYIEKTLSDLDLAIQKVIMEG